MKRKITDTARDIMVDVPHEHPMANRPKATDPLAAFAAGMRSAMRQNVDPEIDIRNFEREQQQPSAQPRRGK